MTLIIAMMLFFMRDSVSAQNLFCLRDMCVAVSTAPFCFPTHERRLLSLNRSPLHIVVKSCIWLAETPLLASGVLSIIMMSPFEPCSRITANTTCKGTDQLEVTALENAHTSILVTFPGCADMPMQRMADISHTLILVQNL